MSNASEPAQNPLDALEALYAAQRRPSERPEPPRLAAINELAALARAPRPEPIRPVPVPPLGERIESGLPESARRRIAPEVVPEPKDFHSGGLRRKIVAGVIGVVAAVAIAAVVTLLLVDIFPRDRDSADPAVTAATAPPPQSAQTETAPQPVSQVQAPAATNDSDQNFNHEQSEQLLQQFMQWQQKAASSDKP
jgi:hypothetical protein